MNADMVAEHTPALGSKLFTLGSTYDDGLGIRLGESVGAQLKHMDQPFITAPFYPPSTLVTGLIVNKRRGAVRGRGLLHARTSGFVMEQPDAAAYLIVDSEHVEHPKMPLVPFIDGWETVEEMEAGLELPAGSLVASLRALQRVRRPRRGPRLPQVARLARSAGDRARGVPSTSPSATRCTPASPSAASAPPSTARSAPRRTGRPRPLRRRRVRVEHRAGRQGVRLRHPARRGVVLRPAGWAACRCPIPWLTREMRTGPRKFPEPTAENPGPVGPVTSRP